MRKLSGFLAALLIAQSIFATPVQAAGLTDSGSAPVYSENGSAEEEVPKEEVLDESEPSADETDSASAGETAEAGKPEETAAETTGEETEEEEETPKTEETAEDASDETTDTEDAEETDAEDADAEEAEAPDTEDAAEAEAPDTEDAAEAEETDAEDVEDIDVVIREMDEIGKEIPTSLELFHYDKYYYVEGKGFPIGLGIVVPYSYIPKEELNGVEMVSYSPAGQNEWKELRDFGYMSDYLSGGREYYVSGDYDNKLGKSYTPFGYVDGFEAGSYSLDFKVEMKKVDGTTSDPVIISGQSIEFVANGDKMEYEVKRLGWILGADCNNCFRATQYNPVVKDNSVVVNKVAIRKSGESIDAWSSKEDTFGEVNGTGENTDDRYADLYPYADLNLQYVFLTASSLPRTTTINSWKWLNKELLVSGLKAGDYDYVVYTSDGREHTYHNAIKVVEGPAAETVSIAGDGIVVSVLEEGEGDYITVFVYGTNLTRDNVPVFYPNANSSADEQTPLSDGKCYGFDQCCYTQGASGAFYRVKLNSWSQFYDIIAEKGVCGVTVPGARYYDDYGNACDDKMMHFYHLIEGDIGLYELHKVPGFECIRVYLKNSSAQKGTTVKAQVFGTGQSSFVVQENLVGLRYFDIPSSHVIYQKVLQDGYGIDMDINRRTYWAFRPFYQEDSEYVHNAGFQYGGNISVPAGCYWEVHSIFSLDVLCSGEAAEASDAVLTEEQVEELAESGTLRVCVRDSSGELIQQYPMIILKGAESYPDRPDPEVPADPTEPTDPLLPTDPFGPAVPALETFTIKFSKNAAEATGKMDTMAACKSGELPTLPANKFVNPGRAFEGWTLYPKENRVMYADKQQITDAVERYAAEHDGKATLYAVWKTGFNLIYYMNTGNFAPSDIAADSLRYNAGTDCYTGQYSIGKAKAFATPVKEGYTFGGWYKEAICKTKMAGITNKTTGDVKVYAKWTANKYTVVFDKNGATSGKMAPMTCIVDQEGGLRLSANQYEKKGASFAGWSLEKEAKVLSSEEFNKMKDKVIADGEAVTTVIGKDRVDKNSKKFTLYPVWTNKKYNIKYVLNGGIFKAGYTALLEYEFGMTEYPALPGADQVERDGFTFAGWCTTPQLNKTFAKLTKTTSGDLVLFAKWKGKYAISYDANGGTGTMAESIYDYEKAKALPASKITREGCKFAGWNHDQAKAAAGEIEYLDREKILSPANVVKTEGEVPMKLQLYAVWRTDFDIRYHTNGGTIHAEGSLVYDAETETYQTKYPYGKEMALAVPEKTGYTFAGWYTDVKLKKKLTGIKTSTSGDFQLYAKWKGNTYTVEFYRDQENATAVAGMKQKMTVGGVKALSKNKMKKPGYNFNCWIVAGLNEELSASYTQRDLEEKYFDKIEWSTQNGKTTGTLKVYGKWDIITYTITWKSNVALSNYGDPAVYRRTYTAADTFNLPVPTRNGFKFVGWYTDAKYKKAVTSIERNTTGDKVFYAKWEKL